MWLWGPAEVERIRETEGKIHRKGRVRKPWQGSKKPLGRYADMRPENTSAPKEKKRENSKDPRRFDFKVPTSGNEGDES
jgi:hypothetical protein